MLHVLSDQCVLTNDCDDGVFINTLKHITEVSHHDGCHLYHLPASAAALINLFTHVNIVTGNFAPARAGRLLRQIFYGPDQRPADVQRWKWFITQQKLSPACCHVASVACYIHCMTQTTKYKLNELK